MIARDVTGFYAFFSAWRSGHFSTFWGDFLTKLQKLWRQRRKNPLEKIQKKKSSGDSTPKLQMNLSLVVVNLTNAPWEKHKIPKYFSLSPIIFELNIFEISKRSPLITCLSTCQRAQNRETSKSASESALGSALRDQGAFRSAPESAIAENRIWPLQKNRGKIAEN